MKTRLKLRPGQRGTKKLTRIYGEKLIAVRYRYDEVAKKRYTTVELIVDEAEWRPRPKAMGPDTLVGVRVAYHESELKLRVKKAGARWDSEQKLWIMPLGRAMGLELGSRVVRLELEGCI